MLNMGGTAPFQIDGSLGAPAAMIESILQSHENILPAEGDGNATQVAYTGEKGKIPLIRLLPSLPEEWAANGGGSAKGLRARGGFTVDISWEGAGALVSASLTSDVGNPVYVTLGQTQVGGTEEGTAIQVDGDAPSGSFIHLEGEKGEVYNITLAS